MVMQDHARLRRSAGPGTMPGASVYRGARHELLVSMIRGSVMPALGDLRRNESFHTLSQEESEIRNGLEECLVSANRKPSLMERLPIARRKRHDELVETLQKVKSLKDRLFHTTYPPRRAG